MRPQMVVVLLIPLYKYIANWDPLENSTFGLDLYLIALNVVVVGRKTKGSSLSMIVFP